LGDCNSLLTWHSYLHSCPSNPFSTLKAEWQSEIYLLLPPFLFPSLSPSPFLFFAFLRKGVAM
jgi:hypothetical protein